MARHQTALGGANVARQNDRVIHVPRATATAFNQLYQFGIGFPPTPLSMNVIKSIVTISFP